MIFNVLKNKKILITGHTGFKGSWLCKILNNYDTNIYGYSLSNGNNSFLYNKLNITDICNNECFNDIYNFNTLNTFIKNIKPDIIFHLAALPLVRKSYAESKYTFETNAIGTLNILECLKDYNKPCQVICITTDKVYENNELNIPFVENDKLGGYDPYSASKACAEIIIDSYRKSFFNPNDYNKTHQIQLASARAGNVIGGGDFAEDRIIPDIIRSIENNKILDIRNPKAIRPWQHVLEPLYGYIELACKMHEGFKEDYCSAFNFGPNEESFETVLNIVDKAISIINKGKWNDISNQQHVHEAHTLKLDITKAQKFLNWHPKWNLDITLLKTFDWYKVYLNDKDLIEITERQIKEYEEYK